MVDELSIQDQGYFGLRIRIVGGATRLPHIYSMRVYRLRMYPLDRMLMLFMEQVLYLQEGILKVGAIECTGYNDTISFGGITMNSFTFGSCFNEIDFTYPER